MKHNLRRKGRTLAQVWFDIGMAILPTTGIFVGTAPFGVLRSGKIPRGDKDRKEKTPAANSGMRTGTMFPTPKGPRIYRILLIYPPNL